MFEEILKKLSVKLKPNNSIISDNSQIYELKEYNGKSANETLKNDILYFVHDANLLETPIPRNLAFTGDTSSKIQALFVNALQFEVHDYKAAVNLTSEILNKAYRLQSLYSSILHTIFDGKDISGILSDIADRAESSAIIIDMSGKILANSTPLRMENRLWTQSVQQGYCPTEFMEHIRELRQKKENHPDTKPYISICEDMQLSYLCSKIMRDDTLFGYIFMIQTSSEFDPDCYEMLSLISKTLTETILRDQDKFTLQSHLYGNILTDMLNGISESQAKTRIQITKLIFPSYMRVLVVNSLYYHGEASFNRLVQAQLENIFQVEQSIVYQNSIVLIIGVQKSRAIPQEQMEQLKELCEKNYLLAGISNFFSDPAKFQVYYHQAGKAVILSKRMEIDGLIHNYTDYAFFDMLDALPKDLRLTSYCHPILSLLRDYDKRKGTKLYETLRTYTLTGFNQNKTAELLFLHRNTMNYRRQKIMELFEIDLEDPHIKFLLNYSFHIDLFQEKIR